MARSSSSQNRLDMRRSNGWTASAKRDRRNNGPSAASRFVIWAMAEPQSTSRHDECGCRSRAAWTMVGNSGELSTRYGNSSSTTRGVSGRSSSAARAADQSSSRSGAGAPTRSPSWCPNDARNIAGSCRMAWMYRPPTWSQKA